MVCLVFICFVFFFQAEDGIRDGHVTGVQTCALPISAPTYSRTRAATTLVTACPPEAPPRTGSDREQLHSARAKPWGSGAKRVEDCEQHPSPCHAAGDPRRARRAQIGSASCRARGVIGV